jgi:hypothetical protein
MLNVAMLSDEAVVPYRQSDSYFLSLCVVPKVPLPLQ